MDRKATRTTQNIHGFGRYADSRLNRWRSQKGMTLVECLTALGICAVFLAGVFSFVVLFQKSQLEYQINIKLANDARLLIDKLVWGSRVAGVVQRRGIAEARQATVTTNQIDYVDADGVTHTVRMNAGNVEYRRGLVGAYQTVLDPNGAPLFDPAVYSTNLVFTQNNGNPRTVQIAIALGQQLQGRWYYVTLQTTVFFRNS